MSNGALHVARTGLDAQNMRMQVIANNLANVNTTGFKRDRANFATLAYQLVTQAGAPSSSENKYATGLNLGTGVSIQGTARIETQGTLNATGNTLDMAIQGEGYFQVQMPDGRTAFTRAGNFSVSGEGVIVTSDGMPVQPQMQVPNNTTSLTVAADGTISATVEGQAEATEVGRIEIARFVNAAGLQSLGGNLLVETAASGAPQVGAPGTEGRGMVKSGMLEASNVNVVEELVDMIETQRAYEVNSKMIQATDEMLRNANGSSRPLILAALVIASPALAKRAPAIDYAPALPIETPAPATPGAIFGAGYAPLTSGARASQVGDVLTVVLVERTQATKSNSAKTGRDGSIGLTPPGTGPLSFFKPSDVNMGGTSSFNGKEAEQSNALSGEVSVTVMAVRPNGTMLVRGEKALTLNRGDERVQLSGIVRATDIGPDNRILSTRIADARIAYTGKGEIARASRQGWIQRFFSMVSPF